MQANSLTRLKKPTKHNRRAEIQLIISHLAKLETEPGDANTPMWQRQTSVILDGFYVNPLRRYTFWVSTETIIITNQFILIGRDNFLKWVTSMTDNISVPQTGSLSGPARQTSLTGRRTFGKLMLGGAFAIAGCSGGGSETRRVLYSAASQPNGYPTVEAVKAMGKFLEEKTDGRLSVKVFPGGQLGSEGSTLEIAMFGGLDMTRTFSAALNNIAPLTKLFSLPFLFRSTKHQRDVADGEVGEAILESLESYGLRGLAIYDTGGRGFYTTERPIPHPSALEGLKIRVPNSDIFLATVKALGANPTPMNFSEVYQGLVQNVIDGAENNWPSYISTRHYEVAPFYSETGHFRTPDMLIMSLRTWQNFSAKDQELVKQAARHSVGVMRSLWDARVEAAKQALLDSGGKILSDIDSGPFRELMGPVYEQFVTPELKPYLTEIDRIAEAG